MFGVDVGGTFTDVVAFRDGRIAVTKVASSPAAPAEPVVEGARRLGVAGSRAFHHASTMGLNAVLERRLPKVAFLTTDGFRDILDRGTVHRPLDAQTDPAWRRSFGDAARPLVPRYLRRGVVERMSAAGGVLLPLDEGQAVGQLEVLRRCGVRGVAICLLHAYADARHERRLRELVHDVLGPDVAVSISSETSPLAKEYARASTTVVDVLMKLLFHEYAGVLHRDLGALGFDGDLRFADCTAALLPWESAMRTPFRIVFAGPAAGTVAGVQLGGALGRGDLICADVGGTSTDVSLVVGGRPFVQNTFELEHDLVINALSTEVASVGAGGGSLVTVSASGGIQVGPGSAGADPGPACYGRGGTVPAVTDACLLMGVLRGDGFAGGEIPLDADAARRAFEALDTPVPFEDRVRSAFHVAVTHVAEEIAGVAVRHGVDVRDFSLLAYGAAGPMLLPAVLDLVPLREVVVPPHPGLFSALGLLSTDLVHHESCSAYLPFTPENADRIEEVFAGMERDLRAQVGPAADGVPARRSFDGRLLGQSWETPFVEMSGGPVTARSIGELVRRFHDGYEARNGNRFDAIPVEGVTYRVHLTVPAGKVTYPRLQPAREPAHAEATFLLEYLTPEPLPAGEYRRAALGAGAVVPGPAVIREDLATTFVLPGQRATVGALGEIVIERTGGG
ncbi:hydantoinase/oxoprolinase family protein [Pseudonocardia sp. MH-G8]|uniref:hydantoinase/oxoprolinase family protein n=1 Tax=Pseudonocardia sp. MH-G8 TaxID=1854588 RepID=UPI000BA09204|nr:hydantoinase/oxoprolinase family protein [Pseudonocardia sp. MH-G8]OZM81350.1 5-oxoprolinase [Pseudonocardia sp. MH-G8]